MDGPGADGGGGRWPLRVRVSGGRLDHRARYRAAAGRRSVRRVWLELACGRHRVTEADLQRPLSGAVCPGCQRQVADDADPARVRRRAAELEESRAARLRQESLFPARSAI